MSTTTATQPEQLDLPDVEPRCSRAFEHGRHETTEGTCPGRRTASPLERSLSAEALARFRARRHVHRAAGRAVTEVLDLDFAPAHCAGTECLHDHRRTA
ncbi:hypothetical protein [Nocardioides sp. AX2bis]|uniref:hypothetical protein n=1 Tax=Nocardioides sp. AX2bis TaxID=2653157 RepID=UPI0012F03909|nr:hypothetical protein [Nocardioides sp. AX2bis]VXB33722.1 hypothetical protein NOCARDAX2BIS_210076 [Nocardioides sp. AX2bis]